jgi:aspartyl-tRNA(Asn)/glutamyl-tRNA(Gln) amidotransferase subunit C
MSVQVEEIEKIAELARIRVADSEVAELTDRIGAILAMVDQMQAVDTSGVEPMSNPLNAVQRLRSDTVRETDKRQAFQDIAPLVEDGLYLVPRVID